jgi:Protein of unknown function (DUF2510)
MTGQISSLSVELAAAVVAASMLIGAIDIARQPGWAWKQVEESKPAYLILVLLLPVIGLAMYVFRARPKVTATVAAGSVATDAVIDAAVIDTAATGADPGPAPVGVPDGHGTQHAVSDAPAFAHTGDRFTGFREVAENGHPGPWETEAGSEEAEAFEVSSTFFSTGVATRSVRHPLALARGYRPKQRTSLDEEHPPEPEAEVAPIPVPHALAPEPATMAAPEAAPDAAPVAAPVVSRVTSTVTGSPTVPSGWKVDPTARHQFRYWDGFHWTENVADNGDESRDAVVSA